MAGKVETETMRQMRKGIHIAEGFVQVDGAKLLKSRSRSTELEIVLREGKNREIRRILARLGHKVQTLRRIAVGPLRLGDVPPGAYRVVSSQEVEKLWTATETDAQDTTRRSRGRRSSQHAGSQRSGSQRSGSQRSGSQRPRTAKKGVSKQIISKGTTSKTSTPKAGPNKRRGTKKAPDTRKQNIEFNFSASQGTTAGRVIGGDADSTEERSSRSGTKRKSIRSKPTSRNAKTAKKASTKRGGSKTRNTIKRKNKSGSAATSTGRDKNRRGAGRTRGANTKTGNQKKSGPNRKRRK